MKKITTVTLIVTLLAFPGKEKQKQMFSQLKIGRSLFIPRQIVLTYD
jgi:hypothetical protein